MHGSNNQTASGALRFIAKRDPTQTPLGWRRDAQNSSATDTGGEIEVLLPAVGSK